MPVPSLWHEQAYTPVASFDTEDDEPISAATRRYATWPIPIIGIIAVGLSALSYRRHSKTMALGDETLGLESADGRLSTVLSSSATHRVAQHQHQRLVDIVHIVMDDVGQNDMWATRDLVAAHVTPRITALARHGLILSNYYGQSYCTPARAAMLTGKFVHKLGFSGDDARGGQVEIKALSNFSLPLGHRLVPEVCS